MTFCKRILAGLALLLGAVGLLLSLAGGVGVWMVTGPATERATRVFERLDAALDAADRALGHVQTSLARAAERLDSARQEQAELSRQPQPNNASRRLLARTVQQRLAPELGAAQEKLHTVAEAAVAVNSVLEDVSSLPFLSTSGLDIDRLTEMNRRLGDVGPAAWELSRLLGEAGPESDAASTQLSGVEQSLQRLRELVAEYEPRVQEVRQRTAALKSKTLAWITPAATVFSLVCVWLALSQVSLLFHAWSWWKHSASHKAGFRQYITSGCALLALYTTGDLQAADSELRVVTLGDSITRGVRPGVKEEETFAALLQDGLRKQGIKAEVKNVGIGGERTDQALKRLDKAVLALKPQVVVIMYGTNDSYVDRGQKEPRLSADQYGKNLRELVAEVRKAGALPILMTPPRWGDKAEANGAGEHPNVRLEQYVRVCRDVAKETKTPLVDHFEHWSKQAAEKVDIGAWTTDQCHPNPRGHKEIAEKLLPVVVETWRPKKE